MINPMIIAIGIVITTVNNDHEASCIALIQANESPASVKIKMNKMAKPATVPVVLPISLDAIVAKLCP